MRSESIDGGTPFDWGKTSQDYAAYRPGYPPAFYDLLAQLGIGLPNQRILDLGTGTGVLARAFAARGGRVTGVDIAAEQIRAAEQLTREAGLGIRFLVGKAEDFDFPAGSFDIASAGQSWIYFDASRLIPKLQNWLIPDGRLVLTHLNWLPREDPVARASEALVLRYSPGWIGADFDGDQPSLFPPSMGEFRLTTFHREKVALPFTRESWRGRIRACRGVGATLPPEKLAEFDRDHAALLEPIASSEFTVLHQIALHIYTMQKRDTGEVHGC